MKPRADPFSTWVAGRRRYHLIVTLSFSSLVAINAALVSPQGQATAADLGNFATGGVDLYIADTETI